MKRLFALFCALALLAVSCAFAEAEAIRCFDIDMNGDGVAEELRIRNSGDEGVVLEILRGGSYRFCGTLVADPDGCEWSVLAADIGGGLLYTESTVCVDALGIDYIVWRMNGDRPEAETYVFDPGYSNAEGLYSDAFGGDRAAPDVLYYRDYDEDLPSEGLYPSAETALGSEFSLYGLEFMLREGNDPESKYMLDLTGMTILAEMYGEGTPGYDGPEQESGREYAVAMGSVNVRDVPSMNGEVLFTLTEGEWIPCSGEIVRDKRGIDWYGVEFNETGIGWVSSSLCRLTGDPGKEEAEEDAEPACVIVHGSLSNVREEPYIGAKVLVTLTAGEQRPFAGSIEEDERGIDWYRIEYENGRYGWISSEVGALAYDAEEYIVAEGNIVNVRAMPFAGAKVLGVLHRNECLPFTGAVTYDEEGTDWYCVECDDGALGWISSQVSSITRDEAEE